MSAARIFFQLIADFVVYLGLLIRPRKAIAAENLFLRRQLALYQERNVHPRRIDPATRITLAARFQQVEPTFQDKRFLLRSQLSAEALRAAGVAAPQPCASCRKAADLLKM